jgi:hypothetical protein
VCDTNASLLGGWTFDELLGVTESDTFAMGLVSDLYVLWKTRRQ